MRSARVPVAVLLASLLRTAVAAAQVVSPTGNIYGTVVDEQGRGILQTHVTLSGPGAAQDAVTDGKGEFHFLNLSPGAYRVRVGREGFATIHRDVTVLVGKNAVLTITVSVAGATGAVTVSGQSALVDTRKTETGATYDQKDLHSTPTTRDPWAILRQVPGVLIDTVNVGGEGSGQQAAFVGKGSHSDQNTYNLDGVGITMSNGQTPTYFNFDSLDNIEIATGGSDPSIPTPGVNLNLVTKRGTNQILGSARGLYAENAGWDYGAEVGGPVWRDRLWLWGAFGRLSFLPQDGFTRTGDPVHSQPIITLGNAKLNAQLSPANSFTFAYINSDKENPGQFSGLDRSQPSSIDNHFKTAAYRGEDSEVWSANLFSSLEFTYLLTRISQPAEGGFEPQAIQDQYGVWRNSFVFSTSRKPQYQAGLTTSSFFDTGDLRHELKFGFGYRQLSNESSGAWPGGGIVGQEPPTFGLAQITRDGVSKWKSNFYDTYVGDTIQAGNLTVNVGLRFDYQQSKNLPSTVPANALYPDILPAVRYGGDQGYPITWREVEPRVGATYSLGNDRSTLLRASYSRFANRLNQEITFISAFPGTQSIYYAWADPNGNQHVDPDEIDTSKPLYGVNVDPSNPGAPEAFNKIAKSFRPPTTDELIVGIDREISSDLSATLAYTYRSVHDTEFANPNYNYVPLVGTNRASYQYVGNAVGRAIGVDGFAMDFDVPYFDLTQCSQNPCSSFLLENRPDYTETYNGVELQVVKRLSHGWTLRASVAYNDWQQHVGPGAILNPNNLYLGLNSSGETVDAANNINATWQFNVAGMVQLPLGIQASANFFGRQGYPIVYAVQVVSCPSCPDGRDPIPNPFDNIFPQINSIGANRLPPVLLLDLHVEKEFQVGSMVTISPMLDCFNVANSRTVLQRDGFVGTYNATNTPAFSPATNENGDLTANQAVQFLNGRTLRGGVRVTF